MSAPPTQTVSAPPTQGLSPSVPPVASRPSGGSVTSEEMIDETGDENETCDETCDEADATCDEADAACDETSEAAARDAAALAQAIRNSLTTVEVPADPLFESARAYSPHVPRELSEPAGLLNVGNTCFINCLLQIYFHLPSLRAEVLALPLPPAAWLDEKSANGARKEKHPLEASRRDLQQDLSADPDPRDASHPTGRAASRAASRAAVRKPRAFSFSRQKERHRSGASEPSRKFGKFALELQMLFGRLLCSSRPAVDPSSLLSVLFANSRFKLGDEADASECSKLLFERLEEALAPSPAAAARIKTLLYGSLRQSVEASESDGNPVALTSTCTFSEIILPVGEMGGELHAALRHLTHAQLSEFVTPRGLRTDALKRTSFATLPVKPITPR